jgi:hypothetical protein
MKLLIVVAAVVMTAHAILTWSEIAEGTFFHVPVISLGHK